MSLTPCRFFASGNCRYGDSCRFYHEPRTQQSGGYFPNRTLSQSGFNNQQGQAQAVIKPSATMNQNMNMIYEQVKKDMQEWEQSKIWPYSCYGPVGGKTCVPGFDDLSPEEIRLIYMQLGNNMPPELSQRYQQFNQHRLNYMHLSQEAKAMIDRIVKADITLPAAQAIFGGQPQSQQSGFANNLSIQQQPASIFGQPAPAQQSHNIFGNSPGIGNNFQQPVSGASFLQGQSAQPLTSVSGGSIFGGNQTQSIFGQSNQASTGGIFQQPQQAGLFQPQQPSQPSIFAPQQPVSAASSVPPQGNFFQQPQPQQQPVTNIFQQQPTLQAPPTQQTIFGQQPGTTTFPQVTGNIFGGSANVTQQPPAPNIFGGATQVGANLQQQVPGLATTPQKYVYTPEADLTAEELEAFNAQEFTIENLPVKPPPQSMCL